jgi:hypothetical protein
VIYAGLDDLVEYKAEPEAAATRVHLTPASLDPIAQGSVECRGGSITRDAAHRELERFGYRPKLGA